MFGVNNPMWTMYDDLIEAIPDDIYVEDYLSGCSWTMVKTQDNMGISLTVKGFSKAAIFKGSVVGTALKTIAAGVKSWNYVEASLGMAAINAYYNTPDKIPKGQRDCKKTDAFVIYADAIKDKNVAVIGHFPNIKRQFESICNLSILERTPGQGDYPDSACEYILPNQDFIFITGMTLINKTLPRLLDIASEETKVILVGPSSPLTPVLFEYGISNISGFVVTDEAIMLDVLKRGGKRTIFTGGMMASLSKE